MCRKRRRHTTGNMRSWRLHVGLCACICSSAVGSPPIKTHFVSLDVGDGSQTVWSHSSKHELAQTCPPPKKKDLTDICLCGYINPLEVLRRRQIYGVQLHIHAKFTTSHLMYRKSARKAQTLEIEMWAWKPRSFPNRGEHWGMTGRTRREAPSRMDVFKGQVSGAITLYSPQSLHLRQPQLLQSISFFSSTFSHV